ncbi:hypothetical protein NDU88_004361 [Pleurodeles waltl]|uniref:Secreted protein n=1 Tax=Pleurodeles waltl TaxID=8319 RepID=A0AAV7TR25_PLEWA|nr:hypothetical protein NDU88_004361 [Pleurodeles waltl]
MRVLTGISATRRLLASFYGMRCSCRFLTVVPVVWCRKNLLSPGQCDARGRGSRFPQQPGKQEMVPVSHSRPRPPQRPNVTGVAKLRKSTRELTTTSAHVTFLKGQCPTVPGIDKI